MAEPVKDWVENLIRRLEEAREIISNIKKTEISKGSIDLELAEIIDRIDTVKWKIEKALGLHRVQE